MLAIIFACLLRAANSQYASITESVDVASDANYGVESNDGYTRPTLPVAPPRILTGDGLSLGYRPPPPPIRRVAKSSGKCSFDHNSWRFEPQTAVANAVMFERRTGSTCDDCIRRCLYFQDSDSEWVCRSLTFDHHWKICDLFAVNGTSPPHFLTEYLDRDYLEYLQINPSSDVHSSQYLAIPDRENKSSSYLTVQRGTRIAETKTKYRSDSSSGYQASPIHRKWDNRSSEKLCGDNDVTRYVMISNYEQLKSATDTKPVKGESLKGCVRACDEDETFTCSSVIHRGEECELSVSKAVHKSSDDFVYKENSTYLEKFCLPANSAHVTGKLWPTVLDHILVGHVMEVTNASSLSECMTFCLQAEQDFSFVCRSAMWYPNDEDQNCLLNTGSRETQPNVFVAEDQGVRMFYFEVPRIHNKKAAFDVFRDDPVEDDYTRWSSCDSSNLQHRYLKCKEQTDVRKCPQQTKFCKQDPDTSSKTKCLAVRDSSGRKKCPHGIRRGSGGHIVHCKNPIDCDL
ncbi:unnamed protein product [Litomosoides sigmodontis]|uniref:Apple domain-containing protein n=1 Tax=Litomosoides sigmodontis TaxID=42156 RepID=A0A3P6S6Z6_LITSI|nr:unnamed protein product [Litomosoides sigmodontis]